MIFTLFLPARLLQNTAERAGCQIVAHDGLSLPAAAAALLLGAPAPLLRFDAPFLGGAGGAGFLAHFGFDQRRSYQRGETVERFAAILLLAALAARLEQDAAVVDQFLAGEAAQAILGGRRQAGVDG